MDIKSLNEARAIRYLLDAIDDNTMADMALHKGIFTQLVFHCQQLCEKFAKACVTGAA